jgi:hypothetical protein
MIFSLVLKRVVRQATLLVDACEGLMLRITFCCSDVFSSDPWVIMQETITLYYRIWHIFIILSLYM